MNDWLQWSTQCLDMPTVLVLHGHTYGSKVHCLCYLPILPCWQRLKGFSPRNYSMLSIPLLQCVSLGEAILSMCLSLSTCLCRKHDAFVPLCHQPRLHHSIPSCPSLVYGDLGVSNILSDPLVLWHSHLGLVVHALDYKWWNVRWKKCGNEFHTYSDSKNWFTFGNFFLARLIVAQIAKLNSWKFLVTKQSIMALFAPNVKTLAPCVDLIQHLQWLPLDEPVFVLSQFFGFVTDITWLNLQYHVNMSQ